MPKFKVVGIAPIVGVDDVTVQPGGTVELDPAATNIDALVMSGCVEPVKKAKGGSLVPGPRGEEVEGTVQAGEEVLSLDDDPRAK